MVDLQARLQNAINQKKIPDQALLDRVQKNLGTKIEVLGRTYEEVASALADANAQAAKMQTQLQQVSNDAQAGAMQASGLTTELKKCVNLANNNALYSQTLSVGAGVLLRGDNGHVRHLQNGGNVVWGAYRFPVTSLIGNDAKAAKYLMLGIYARQSWGEYVTTGDKTTPEIKASVTDAWVGLERYTQTSKLAAQVGWMQTKDEDGQNNLSKSGFRYLISAGLPILSKDTGIWLGGTYGNSRGTVTSLNDHVFLLTLEFAPPKAADIFKLSK